MKKIFTTYEKLCKLPLGWSLWGLLFFLIFATACTNDVAEVNTSQQQEQYVTVRMNVPGMQTTVSRTAEDGLIETVHALAFNSEGTHLGTSEATNLNNVNANDGYNGTFSLTVPNGTTTIHFLANLPDDYDLSGVNKESDLCNLSIGDWQNLRYWGMATTSDGNTNPLNVTLYRNLARISIKPSVTAPELNQFTQEQLKMTGFYMPNERGALIPNNNGTFDFDMNSNYCTIPHPVTSANYQLWGFTSMYAFEHENTDSNPTYIICKIGDYHYKVALVDDEGNRYPIIRNHEYIIYVSDVDDYAYDSDYRAENYSDAFNKKPINLDVEEVEYETVEVSMAASTNTLDYNTTSISNLVLSVTVPPEVNTLTLNTPGFTMVKYSSLSYEIDGNNQNYLVKNNDGSFTVNHPENDVSHTFSFRLKLDDNPQQSSYNLSCTAASNDANVQITQPSDVEVLLNKVDDNENIYWMGASSLDYGETATKIPVLAEKLTLGATVTFEYEKGNDAAIDLQNAKWGNFTSLTTLDLSNSTMTSFTIDETLYNEIQANKNQVYELPDAGMVVQGKNVTLKKITIQPAVTFEYQDNQTLQVGGDPLTVTMRVPDGGTLNTLTISAPGFTIKQDESELGTDSYNGTNLNYTNRDITYTFVPNSAGRKTITFSNAQGTNLNISSLPVIEVTVNATITATPTQQTIYYDGNNKSFNVSVNIPKGVNALSIDGAGSFNVTRQSQNGTLDDNTYTPNDTNGQTAVFTFTYNGAQSESTQTITFKDASNNPNVTGASVTVSVKKTETEEPVLVEGENNLPLNNLPLTLQNNNGEVLLKASGNNENGLLESYRTYLKEGVTLKITFTFDGDTNPLSFQTTWSDPVEGVFSQIDSNKYLSYTFKSSDFDKGNGGAHTIANAGLELKTAPNSTATITAISIIIPASTP